MRRGINYYDESARAQCSNFLSEMINLVKIDELMLRGEFYAVLLMTKAFFMHQASILYIKLLMKYLYEFKKFQTNNA